MKKDTLSVLCEDGLSTRGIAEYCGVSQTTVRYYLRKFDLKTRLGKKYTCSCGVTGKENFHAGRVTKCKKCANESRLERNQERRKFVIDHLGGKCVSCGFDDYICSLHVHHTDPTIKDPNFESMRSWSEERILEEAETCILLCANCHAAHHAGHDIEFRFIG